MWQDDMAEREREREGGGERKRGKEGTRMRGRDAMMHSTEGDRLRESLGNCPRRG